MASGSTSRRSSRPRPGKRYMVVSQAVPVPMPSVRTPTPRSSRPVSASAPGSTVRTRCGHTLSRTSRESTTMVASGSAMMPATATANSVAPQASPGRRSHRAQGRRGAGRVPALVREVGHVRLERAKTAMRQGPTERKLAGLRQDSSSRRRRMTKRAYTGTMRSLPNEMVTRVPWPGVLSTASLAPLAAASARVSGRPSPRPARSALGALAVPCPAQCR